MTTKTDEQQRAEFEAWWDGLPQSMKSLLTYEVAKQAYELGRAALQPRPEVVGVTLDGCLETLFRVGEYLGIDYVAARKAPRAPSDVYIKAIEDRAVLQSQDREDAQRYRWLLDKFQQSYDGEDFEAYSISIYSRMISQFKGERAIRAEISWWDKTDEPIGLSEAIDHARRAEENK